jgi:hypothetical protein
MQDKYLDFLLVFIVRKLEGAVLPHTARNTPKYTTPGTPRPTEARHMINPVAMQHMKKKINGER